MTQITDNSSKKVQQVLEFQHNWKYVKNRQYAINAVDKAISRGQNTIVLDPNKLKAKQYISTEVFLYDRQGQALKVEGASKFDPAKRNWKFDYSPSNDQEDTTIYGVSWPQYGDRFNKKEGRKYALLNALNRLVFTSNDTNFKDLFSLKKFLQLDIKAKSKYPHWRWPNSLISWEYIDLWNALLAVKYVSSDDPIAGFTHVVNAAIELVGQTNYDNLFVQFIPEILNFFYSSQEFNNKKEELTIEAAYYFYSSAIAQFYNELNTPEVTLELENNVMKNTDDLIELLQDELQG